MGKLLSVYLFSIYTITVMLIKNVVRSKNISKEVKQTSPVAVVSKNHLSVCYKT